MVDVVRIDTTTVTLYGLTRCDLKVAQSDQSDPKSDSIVALRVTFVS